MQQHATQPNSAGDERIYSGGNDVHACRHHSPTRLEPGAAGHGKRQGRVFIVDQ